MDQQNAISRRRVIGRLGVSLAAVAAAPTFSARAGSKDEAMPEKLQDPTTEYPKPPFKTQEQPWPGWASKMEPRLVDGTQGVDHRR